MDESSFPNRLRLLASRPPEALPVAAWTPQQGAAWTPGRVRVGKAGEGGGQVPVQALVEAAADRGRGGAPLARWRDCDGGFGSVRVTDRVGTGVHLRVCTFNGTAVHAASGVTFANTHLNKNTQQLKEIQVSLL